MKALAVYSILATVVLALGAVLLTGSAVIIYPWVAALALVLSVPVMVLGVILVIFTRQTA